MRRVEFNCAIVLPVNGQKAIKVLGENRQRIAMSFQATSGSVILYTRERIVSLANPEFGWVLLTKLDFNNPELCPQGDIWAGCEVNPVHLEWFEITED